MKFPAHHLQEPRGVLESLYQSATATIELHRHIQSPRNLGRLDTANACARGVGSCGDSIEVYLQIEKQIIQNIGHVPNGCGFTVACASAMSELVRGLTLDQALNITPEGISQKLGDIPQDHRHCASLAVNTLGEAIDDYLRKQWGKTGNIAPNR